MVGRIPQSFIDELVSRIDIVDVIGERVPLKKAGREFKACCPFHDEKTPSFTVSPSKQFYHCFGCGAHGTVLGFLIDYGHMEFPEAVEELASRIGLDVPREAEVNADTVPSTAPLRDLLERADEHFRRQLRSHPEAARAIAYLKGRGVSGEVARDFHIGFAPPGWDLLISSLGGSEADNTLLVEAGLAIRGDNRRLYDRFRDRVMFPIRDGRGRVVGFGGRVIDADQNPKYLNSPETPVFHKGRELYGLWQAKRAHRQLTHLLVVEGYMDVVALAQHGLSNAVATLGTAATSDHVERLFRSTSEVFFCFDGDDAGRRAAWRALETVLPVLQDGRTARFLFLPQGEDPDSLVRREGRQGFEQRLRTADSALEYLFSHLQMQVDMSIPEGRVRLVELSRPLLGRLPAGAMREVATQTLADLSGISRERLARVAPLKAATSRVSGPPSAKALVDPPPRDSPVRKALLYLVHEPSLALERCCSAQELADLQQPWSSLLARVLAALRESPSLPALLERLRGDPGEQLLAQLAAENPLLDASQRREEYAATIAHLLESARVHRLDARIAELGERERSGLLVAHEQQELKQLIRERLADAVTRPKEL